MSLNNIKTNFRNIKEKKYGNFNYKIAKALDDNIYRVTIKKCSWNACTLHSILFFTPEKLSDYFKKERTY